jgi:hypothetical protein
MSGLATEMRLTMSGVDNTGSAFASVGSNAQKMMGQMTSLEYRMKDMFKEPHVNLMHLSRGMVQAFSIGGLLLSAKEAANQFASLAEHAETFSNKLGTTIEQYQTWATVCSNMNISLKTTDELLEKLSKRGFTPAEINAVLGIPAGASVSGNVERANTMSNANTPGSIGNLIGEGFSRMGIAGGALLHGNFREAGQALHGELTDSTFFRLQNEKKLNDTAENTLSEKELAEQKEKYTADLIRRYKGEQRIGEELQKQQSTVWADAQTKPWMPKSMELQQELDAKMADAKDKFTNALERAADHLAPWVSAGGYSMVKALYGSHQTESSGMQSREQRMEDGIRAQIRLVQLFEALETI